MPPSQVRYKTSDEVDFVIIGSGAAGGVLAKELATNDFRVVVLEQGPYLTEADFVHDEVKVLKENLLTNHPELQPSTFHKTADVKAAVHLLGTCRMGNDPKASVINADHRSRICFYATAAAWSPPAEASPR
jgi:choline dehydrogenase-like flavoprotein